MKIVVLAGGISSERQVSLVSGTCICRGLRERGHQAILVDLYLGMPHWAEAWEAAFEAADGFCSQVSVGRDAPSLEEVRRMRPDPDCRVGPGVLELCRLADLVFLGLHGEDGEDGKVQAMLELMGIPYTGSGFLGSAMAMDKVVTKRVMEQNGIRTPAWRELHVTEETIPALMQELTLPCVLKTPNGGSSIGIMLPETAEELEVGLHEVARFSSRVLIEARITGRELTVPVFDGKYLSAIEIVPPEGTYFDYVAKYQSTDEGGAQEICPAPITEAQAKEMGEMALKLHNALGLSVYSRTDFLLDAEGTPWCLEINTLPGMTPASLLPQSAAVAGYPYPVLCETIAELSLKVHR